MVCLIIWVEMVGPGLGQVNEGRESWVNRRGLLALNRDNAQNAGNGIQSEIAVLKQLTNHLAGNRILAL
jgi:hypothetical protein